MSHCRCICMYKYTRCKANSSYSHSICDTLLKNLMPTHRKVNMRKQCNSAFSTSFDKMSPLWWIKILMACLRIILRVESQTVGISPQLISTPTLNPTNQPIIDEMWILTILARELLKKYVDIKKKMLFSVSDLVGKFAPYAETD